MATIHFKNAIVYMQGSGSEAVPVTEAADVSIDIDYDLEADAAFGDTWKTNLKGLIGWSGSFGGNFDTAQAVLFDAISQTSARKFYAYPDRATTGRYYYGTQWPKLGIQGSGVGKFTVGFTGDGQLAQN